eukprot:Mrub_05048.p1 GENE.Mrub_05048~~Mrub_05048.p1  ORF type:complete len:273 (-),score=72.71 Mrub_05048:318-1136(-)
MGNTTTSSKIRSTKYSLLNSSDLSTFHTEIFLNYARFKRTQIATIVSLYSNKSFISLGGLHTKILDGGGKESNADKCTLDRLKEYEYESDSQSIMNLKDWVNFIYGSKGSNPLDLVTWQGRNVIQVSNGLRHSAILFMDGSVIFFGDNTHEQCSLSKLKKVRAVQVACGGAHSAVLHADGTAVLFGRNEHGQCALPKSLNAGIAKVACGTHHSALLYSDGSVRLIGSNKYGQSPQLSPINRRAKQVACGETHTFVIFDDGTALILGMINLNI